uniref:TTK protein kinase n=1 Tax=Rhinopithecus bieti TaxID=61621 RepID=A0A2K6MJB7_RHIBE
MMHVTTFKWPEQTARNLLLFIYLLHNLNCHKVMSKKVNNFFEKLWNVEQYH